MLTLVVAAIIMFSSGICAASERAAVQVTQPIGGTANEVVLGQVLYVDFFDSFERYRSVRLTASENAVKTDRGAQNLNVAFDFGIKIQILGIKQTSFAEMIQAFAARETLQVEMALPPRGKPSDYFEPIRELIVHATKQCVLENAKRYSPPLKYVSLQVTGDPEFAKLSGVYSLENIPAHLPARSGWGRIR